MLHWYVFHCKAQKEQFLCEQLHLRQMETFFPYLRVEPVNPRARKIQPYFPGYLFGHVDLEESGRSNLRWVPGAIGLVDIGGEPAFVSDHLIQTLKQHVDAINASNNTMPERFKRGDAVTIQGGLFSGYEAIFNTRLPGRERVEVLLKMLQGSLIRIELPIQQITLCHP